jgi:hypothetical protein
MAEMAACHFVAALFDLMRGVQVPGSITRGIEPGLFSLEAALHPVTIPITPTRARPGGEPPGEKVNQSIPNE